MKVNWPNSASAFLLVSVWAMIGCNDSAPRTGRGNKSGEATSGHSHERRNMLLADVGEKYHALLTAHLLSEGNELDIFFETQDEEPIAAAIPLESFTAFITVRGQQGTKEVKFEPAPPEERPKGEKPGTCSHFVAKVPWMKATDVLTVVVMLNLEDERYRVTWNKFDPKKYAHHEE